MMQAAQDRDRSDATDGLNRSAHRRVLAQGEMCAYAVIVIRIRGQDSVQMCLAEHDDVVEALAPDRADHPLDVAILPGRAGCDGSISDSHCSKSLRDHSTIGAIPIADEVSRRLVPRKRLGDLLRDLLRGWGRGHVGPDQLSAMELKDDDPIQQFEADRRYNEEVYSGNVWGMDTEECPPAL